VEDALLEVGEEEGTLEELLGELNGGREDWTVDDEESTEDPKTLMDEARSALIEVNGEKLKRHTLKHDEQEAGREEATEKTEEGPAMDETHILSEDQETEEYIRKALAEAALDNKNDEKMCPASSPPAQVTTSPPPTTETTQDLPSVSVLDLPCTPLELPSAFSSSPTLLPSAPTFAPFAKPQTLGTKHTDEEIETWCCICNDDATVNCLGCEGELYCGNCWNEGHRGVDAGWEERRHKAVRFIRPGGEKKEKVERRAVGVGG